MSATSLCAECGSHKKKRWLWSDGDEHYCNACYQREFEPATCVDCGKATKKHPSHEAPRCQSCRCNARWRGIQCERCGCDLENMASRRGYSHDGRPRCATCAKYFWPPKTCVYCGKVSYDVARDYQHGFDEPACNVCRRESGMHNCAGCRRNRRMAGERDGKQYCKHCLPTGKPPLITCQACGQVKHAYSRTECDECGWERLNQNLLQTLYPKLATPWARELFERYHRESAARSRKGRWRACLRRDIDAFVALEREFTSATDITGVLIVRRLGTPFTNQYRRVMSFLAHAYLIEIDEDPDYRLEYHLARIRSLIPADGDWVSAVLQRFLSHMLHQRSKVADRRRHGRLPLTPKSIESAVRAANDVLVAARDEFGVTEVRGLTQDHVDAVLPRNKGLRTRLAAFIRYFNRSERVFQRLKTYRVPVAFPEHLILPDTTCRAIVAWARKVTRLSDVRGALILLLALIYAQQPHKAIAMPLSAVKETEDGYQITFNKVAVDVDPLVSSLLRRWLGLRREASVFAVTGSSPYLFPGGVATTHATMYTVTKSLRRFKIRSRPLHVTGLASLVRAGVDQPRVLADTFGTSLPRAVKYCAALGAFERQRAKFVVNNHAKR